MREVIILPREDEIIMKKIPTLNENILEAEKCYHSYYLEKYIKNNNIEIETKEKKTSYELSYELSKKGISSIIIENKTMVIFLPEYISINQFSWFKNSYNILRKFNVSFSYIENEKQKLEEPDEDNYQTTCINKFYKYIKSNIKKKRNSDTDEHKRTI